MSTLIIAGLALALVQYWLLPAATLLKETRWLLSSRDEPLDLTVKQQRIYRASANLTESLIPYLGLMLLALHQGVDLTNLATWWIGLRALYIPCYVFGINPIRSAVWIGSVICLVMMAAALV